MNRRCARPACAEPATATLSYAYDQRQVWLDDLWPEKSPANHDLCDTHASRTGPPKGWELRDRRSGVASVEASPAVEGLRYAS